MSLRSVLFLSLALSFSLLVSGCGTIYSFQSYGAPTRGHSISEGAARADVLVNLGSPNSIYKSADTETFVYKGLKGRNWFGLYSTLRRNDLVVVMDGTGKVVGTQTIEVGRGYTFLSTPFTDATHPWRTTDADFEPENYVLEHADEHSIDK